MSAPAAGQLRPTTSLAPLPTEMALDSKLNWATPLASAFTGWAGRLRDGVGRYGS